jgi:hypothetical protein
MSDTPSIIDFVTDEAWLGLTVSRTQGTLLKAIYGMPLEPDEEEVFTLCTGRSSYAQHPFSEASVIAGARSGKDSRIAAPIMAYEAVFGGHERHLAKGERAVLPLVAQDQRATRVAFAYLRDYFLGSPLLSQLVEEVLTLEITLTNGITVLCFPCSLRSLRGFSIPAAVMDELAFYRLEGQADSDVEIQVSIRRGMLGFSSPRLIKISTPYMRSGVLFDDFTAAWGVDDPDRLVWKAPTALMNPSITPERLERERRLDPQRFAREYEAEFAEDIAAFLPSAWVDDAVMVSVHELPPGPP